MAIPPIKTNNSSSILNDPKNREILNGILKNGRIEKGQNKRQFQKDQREKKQIEKEEIEKLNKLYLANMQKPPKPEKIELTRTALINMLNNASKISPIDETTRKKLNKLCIESKNNVLIETNDFNELIKSQNKFTRPVNDYRYESNIINIAEQISNTVSDDASIVTLNALEKIFDNCTKEDLLEGTLKFCKGVLASENRSPDMCKIDVSDEYMKDLLRNQKDNSLRNLTTSFRKELKSHQDRKEAVLLMGMQNPAPKKRPPEESEKTEEPITKSLKIDLD